MIPIQKLLSRIRWDHSFGEAFFEIEYEDRVTGSIRIPFDKITEIDSFAFRIYDPINQSVSIPLHRVKRVYRNGELIWNRQSSN